MSGLSGEELKRAGKSYITKGFIISTDRQIILR
jgi:hypothetical protein